MIQLLGGAYIGFATMNWTAKVSIIGGIYSRPVSLGNCVLFVTGALAPAKQQVASGFRLPLAAALIVYTIFAIWFT